MTASVAQKPAGLNITRQHVGQALRAMRMSAQYDRSELNAVNRAALNLEACTWIYEGSTLVIESATKLGQRWHVQHNGCTCQAGRRGIPCWHLAALRILQRASELVLTPARKPQTDAEYAKTLADCDDMF